MKTSFLLSLFLCLTASASPFPRQEDTSRRDQNRNTLFPDANEIDHDPALVAVHNPDAPARLDLATIRDQGMPTTADRPPLPRVHSLPQDIAAPPEGRTSLPPRRIQQLRHLQVPPMDHQVPIRPSRLQVPQRIERLASTAARANTAARGASRLAAPSTLGTGRGVTEVAANMALQDLAHFRFF